MKLKRRICVILGKLTGVESPYRLIALVYYWLSGLFTRHSPDHFWDGKLTFMRLRLTSRCNCRCRFCDSGLMNNAEKERDINMEPKWLYESCRPLYKNLKYLHFSHGECIIHPEMFNFCRFMREQYPSVILGTESNGLAFTKKWQEIAAENLFMIHFSLNAVTCDTYLKGVWAPGFPGGEAAFHKSRENVKAFIELLKKKGRLCFAPSVSMVINSDTRCEVRDFCRMALEMGARCCGYYFDYTENCMSDEHFTDSTTSEVLVELMKMQKILKDKFLVNFRLWVPLEEIQVAQKVVDSISDEELVREYGELIKLAENRSIIGEYEERETWRREMGLNSLELVEDLQITMYEINIGGKPVCFAPWRGIELYPNGYLGLCGWMKPIVNIKMALNTGNVDWNKVLNSSPFCYIRKEMLKGNYLDCMKCCPLNPNFKPISTNLEYSISEFVS